MAAEILIVFIGFLGRVQVGVARDLNHVRVLHRVHLENLVGYHFQCVLKQYEGVFAVFARELDHALAIARHGNDSHEHVFCGLRARRLALGFRCRFWQHFGFGFLVEAHGDIERAVFKMREGMQRVDDLRRYKWQHILVEVVYQFGMLLCVQLIGVELVNAGVVKQMSQGAVIFGGDGRELAHAGIYGIELLAWRHARFRVEDEFFGQLKVG